MEVFMWTGIVGTFLGGYFFGRLFSLELFDD